MSLEDIFDKDGSFVVQGFDPYRSSNNAEFYDKIFDEDGWVLDEVDGGLWEFIIKNKCGPFSDVVALYHAIEFSNSTKGNYPPIYYWR